MGADQHRVGHVGAHAGGDRQRGGAHLCAAPDVAQRRRAGAGRLGARQHRGRLARVPRPRAHAGRAAAAARAAAALVQDVDAAQRDVDALQPVPRQAPAAVAARRRRAPHPRAAHLLQRRRGAGRRVLGAVVPLRRPKRQDPKGARHGHLRADRGADGPPAGERADARAAHRGQHRHGRRQPDAAGDQLRRAAETARAAQLAQEGDPEGGVLDHLQHHGGHARADPGRHRVQHHPAPRAAARNGGVRHQKGGGLVHLQRDERRLDGPDQVPRHAGVHQAALRPAHLQRPAPRHRRARGHRERP
mmetsp:Transcript_25608/g.74831  ORF Transcript_25608/g.74831 Transcript_25608/m.74831 type:complete len:303 (-) Transcript_25608:734-1642(-)